MTSSLTSCKMKRRMKDIMEKGKQYSQQFKEDAVCYKEDHLELTYEKAANNLGISD